MRTCPACGKENADDVTRCATCDEEIGAVQSPPEPEAEPEPQKEQTEVNAEAPTVTEEDHSTQEHPAAVSEPEPEPEPVPAGVAAEASKAHPTVSMPESAVVAAASAVSNRQTTVQVQGAPGNNALQPGNTKLVVEQGMSVNKEYLLNDPELIIGRRDPEQEFIPDIDLFDQENANNRYISRRQARLYFQEAGLFVEDLDSSNGTCVNNRPIKPNMSVQLHPGDKLLMGQSVMFRVRMMTS